jgi:hypothetical protein
MKMQFAPEFQYTFTYNYTETLTYDDDKGGHFHDQKSFGRFSQTEIEFNQPCEFHIALKPRYESGRTTSITLQDKQLHGTILNAMSAETRIPWIQSPISVLKSGPRVLPDLSTGVSTSPCKPQNRQKHDGWYVPTSTKSIRAVNPVSFAFERLANNVKLGSQRKDGKDPISLAVSSHARVVFVNKS